MFESIDLGFIVCYNNNNNRGTRHKANQNKLYLKELVDMTKNEKRRLYNYCVLVACSGLYKSYDETPPTFEEWDRHLTRCEENRVNNNINIRDFVKQEIMLFEQDVLGDGEADRICKLADSINTWFRCWFLGAKASQGVYLVTHKHVPHIELVENISMLSCIVIIAIIDAYYNWSCPELHDKLHD